MAAITNLSPVLFSLLFGAVSTFVVTMMFRDWRRKKRAVAQLALRPQLNDEQFSRLFDTPTRADIAARARRVLSKNLEMKLDGLAPTDRLNEDLHAELEANPHLFWELESEFRIKTSVDVEDLDLHEKTLEQVATFQGLVEYIEGKIAERATNPPAPDTAEQPPRAYNLAIASIPFLCVGGWLTLVVGFLIGKSTIAMIGTVLFLSGFVVWGGANGGAILLSLVQTIRNSTWKELRSHPWSLLVFGTLALLLLWIAASLTWMILKTKT